MDTSKFEVGGNLAASPGSVVLRTEVFELIQYKPATEQVREVPLLFVPPTINKFYVLDLAPGRSMIEHYVAAGPAGVRDLVAQSRAGAGALRPRYLRAGGRRGPRRGGLDHRPRARSTWRPRARAGSSPPVCSVQLAATGELGGVASLTLMVCALDNDTEGTISALTTRDVAAAAVAESARKGYLDGQALAGVFTWLRPNDLVWNYFVNNYLLGKAPPAFDILYWNQDTVRLAAGLHRDFIHIGLEDSFTRPGALEVLGQPVDLGSVDIDTYFVAGASDHIVSWESAYKGALLFGGSQRFVLSRSGHIQALVNPPGPEGPSPGRASASPTSCRRRPRSSARQAPQLPGSWWSDWDAWLAERSGALKTAPERARQRGLQARRRKAPGTYVLAG